MGARRINAEDLTFHGESYTQVDSLQLHAICLMHMSQFVANPNPTGAAVVAALLDALARHQERYKPACGCGLYAQARALWQQVADGLAETTPSAAAPVITH